MLEVLVTNATIAVAAASSHTRYDGQTEVTGIVQRSIKIAKCLLSFPELISEHYPSPFLVH